MVDRLLLHRHAWIAVVVVTVALAPTVAQAADLTGTWDVVVTTKYSQGKSVLVLVQQGQKLTGSIDGRYGKAPVTGAAKGARFSLTFTLTLEDGKPAKVLYEGRAEANTLTGTVTIPSVIDGSFTATRR